MQAANQPTGTAQRWDNPPAQVMSVLKKLARETPPPAGTRDSARPRAGAVTPRKPARGEAKKRLKKAGKLRPKGLVELDAWVPAASAMLLEKAANLYGLAPGVLVKNLGLARWRVDPTWQLAAKELVQSDRSHIRWTCTHNEHQALKREAQATGARSVAGYCVRRAIQVLEGQPQTPGEELPLLLTKAQRKSLAWVHRVLRTCDTEGRPGQINAELVECLARAIDHLARSGMSAHALQLIQNLMSLRAELVARLKYGADVSVVAVHIRGIAERLAAADGPKGSPPAPAISSHSTKA